MNWLLGYVSGIAVSVLSAVLMGFLFSGLSKIIAIICLLFGFFTFLFIVIKYPYLSSGLKKEEFGFWSWTVIVLFLLFCLRSFLWLIYKKGNDLYILNPNNLGDMPYHIGYIKYFAGGITFWPDSPICTGVKVNYHLGMDLFNSLLVLAGVDLIRGLIWVGLLSSFATILTLLMWGKAFALSGFLFNGGLAGFEFFHTFIFEDYQRSLDWKSIFLTMFIPQRGFLFGIPCGLLLLSSWRERFFSRGLINQAHTCILPFWIEVLLYSVMPLFHIHTFIYLSLLLLIWFFILPNTKRIQILQLGGISFLPALFFLLLITDSFKKGSMIHLDLKWLQGVSQFLEYWVLNYGIFWPLIIWLCIKLIIKLKNSKNFFGEPESAFVFPSVLLFFLFSLVMINAWSFDNAKLLMWSYIILLPYLWDHLLSSLNKIKRYLICFILFFSGFVCLIGGLHFTRGISVFNLVELYDVISIVKNLPQDQRFAAYPTYNHPLLFCGRKVVLGYPGWLWSQGMEMKGKEEKFKRLMLGEPGWENLARELGVRYIFWGEREKINYSLSSKPWEKSCKQIASGTWGQIFDLNLI